MGSTGYRSTSSATTGANGAGAAGANGADGAGAATADAAVPSLLIGGRWEARDDHTAVADPATGKPFAHVARGTRADAEAAIDAAAGAFGAWRATSALERSQILAATAALLRERAEDIGHTLAVESGKLRFEAVAEVRFAADYFTYYAAEATRADRLSIIEGRPSGPQLLLRKPAGVAASLTPWNFPVSIQARKVAPALAAGCTVVARPSEEAPVSVVELFRCLEEAGLPAGVANLVTGPARELSDPILADARVRVVSFTGSTGVGKALYAQAAGTMKRVALELGGCAPFVVCADADLDLAVEQAMIAKFRNNGQSCVAANCFFVERPLYDRFVAALGERIGSMRTGDQLDPATDLGPLIDGRRRDGIAELADRATAASFEHVVTGPAPELGGDRELVADAFFAPQLLAAADHSNVDEDFLATELFGPLALVAGFDDLNGLIARLNRNPLGLAGYVFAGETDRATRIAAALEVGISGVNEGLAGAVNMPMGGVKDSGLGREGGHVGMEEFLDLQYIAQRAAPLGSWGNDA
jgi:succinate-semialdehyde dehydrogenase / glutarate-semialdehyde dehydrogenase